MSTNVPTNLPTVATTSLPTNLPTDVPTNVWTDVPEMIWTTDHRHCVVVRIGGHCEVQLRRLGHLVRIEVCPDESTARRRASEWRALYTALPD